MEDLKSLEAIVAWSTGLHPVVAVAQSLNGPRVAKTVSDRAVVKASGERLLRDFREAARLVAFELDMDKTFGDNRATYFTLANARRVRSRTKYAAILTAFGA